MWTIRVTFTAHGNAIRDTNGVVLPCQHVVILNMLLDLLSQIQHCGVSASHRTWVDGPSAWPRRESSLTVHAVTLLVLWTAFGAREAD